jgi:hypothetical protein
MEAAEMNQANPEEGRGRLGFTSIVLKAFDFLLSTGFVAVRRDPTLVRFESDRVFVSVYHGEQSYHVGLELGRLEEDDIYSLHEVLSTVAPTERDRARYQASDTIVLERCVESIAEIVRLEAGPLLLGDSSAYSRLARLTSESRNKYTLQAQFGAIIDQADTAWEAKDFEQARRFYESAAPALDAGRSRRLDYLRRQEENESTHD